MFDAPAILDRPFDPPVPTLWDLLATDGGGVVDWDSTLAGVLATGPGPTTATVLTTIDPTRLSGEQRGDLVRAWEAQIGFAQAAQADALAALAGEPGPDDDVVRAEVGALLGVAGVTAQHRIDLAGSLAGRLPLSRARLETGRFTWQHISALADELLDLDDPTAQVVEARLIARLSDDVVCTPGQLRRKARRVVAAVDADAALRRHQEAAEASGVTLTPEPDGMAWVAAHLSAVDAQTVWQGLTGHALKLRAAARSESGGGPRHEQPAEQPAAATDHRQPHGLDHWRARALVEWASAALSDPDLPRAHGRSIQLGIVIDLPTLLRLRDEPAELDGYGPIPAEVARSLAGDATWRRWLNDPVDGSLLDLGRERYRPSQAIRDYVTARDRRCGFPTCSQPAWRCDLDHETAWADGGTTTAGQLQALCRHHHRLKTGGEWTVSRAPDGSARWTSPGGRSYRVPRATLVDPP